MVTSHFHLAKMTPQLVVWWCDNATNDMNGKQSEDLENRNEIKKEIN